MHRRMTALRCFSALCQAEKLQTSIVPNSWFRGSRGSEFAMMINALEAGAESSLQSASAA